MKKILFLLGLLTAGATATFAQDKTTDLLNRYYTLKDALVSGNATLAAEQAKAFATDAAALKDDNGKTLIKSAGQIAGTSDIEKQRSYFSTFSDAMLRLVKTAPNHAAPVYKMYCPRFCYRNDTVILPVYTIADRLLYGYGCFFYCSPMNNMPPGALSTKTAITQDAGSPF